MRKTESVFSLVDDETFTKKLENFNCLDMSNLKFKGDTNLGEYLTLKIQTCVNSTQPYAV